MNAKFLGRVALADALLQQSEIHKNTVADSREGMLLGFEAEPVITLGLRAGSEDVLSTSSDLERLGFTIHRVDRGGQATLHHPGQLVIFPVWTVRGIGVQNWVKSLAEITAQTLREWNIESHWDSENPGLYTREGKIMACGVRIRQGVSTHGIALNVSNRLEDFALIRACGRKNAKIDRMGEGINLASVFAVWSEKFHQAHC